MKYKKHNYYNEAINFFKNHQGILDALESINEKNKAYYLRTINKGVIGYSIFERLKLASRLQRVTGEGAQRVQVAANHSKDMENLVIASNLPASQKIEMLKVLWNV